MRLKRPIIVTIAGAAWMFLAVCSFGQVYDPANGHYYQLVTGGIDWFTANSAANAMQLGPATGHLATLTSIDENNFVFNNMSISTAWVGGFQPPGSPEPAGGWQWVTGEPWNYTHWDANQPDNFLGTEDGLTLGGGNSWNDLTRTWIQNAYIVEFDVGGELYRWTNAAGGNFGTTSNWSANYVPTATDPAKFDLASSGYTVTANADITTASLTLRTDVVTLDLGSHTWSMPQNNTLVTFVGDQAGDVGKLQITSGTLATGRTYIGHDGDAQGTLVVSGPTAEFDVINSALFAGGNTTAKGTVTVTNGGKVSVTGTGETTFYIAPQPNSVGVVSVTGTNSKLLVDRMFVGERGSGSLTVGNGGSVEITESGVTIGGTGVAPNLMSTGVVDVDTGGNFKSTSVTVGGVGHGELMVDGGVAQVSGAVALGDSSTGSGEVLVTAGGRISATGGVDVGSSGSGSLTVTSGMITANQLRLGVNGSAVGTVNLNSAGAISVSTSALNDVGRAGMGEFNINGGQFSGGRLRIGTLGLGNGTLVISNGGVVTGTVAAGVASASLGVIDATTRGSAQVTGAGSKWQQNGIFEVGSNGSGTVLVDSQGQISSQDAELATFSTATADFTVDGVGSSLNVANRLAIGGSFTAAGGAANLSVRNGGTASAGTVQIWNKGTLSGDAKVTTTTLTNGGRVTPGNGNGAGILTIDGNFTQSSTGTLQIKVGGRPNQPDKYDQLVVTGAASLAGRLEVPIVNGFHPQVGDTYTFLNAGSLTGNFSSVVSPNLNDVDPNIGIFEFASTANHNATLQFVQVTDGVKFVTATDVADWSAANTWSDPAGPNAANKVTIDNLSGQPQRVNVTTDIQPVHHLDVTDDSTPVTVRIQNNKSLTSTTEVVVASHGAIELGQPTIASDKGTLNSGTVMIAGGGQVAGNGTVAAEVTLQDGTASPGFNSPGATIGHLEFKDYHQMTGGDLNIDLQGTSAGQFDSVNVTGAAQLGGTLTINAANFNPAPGTRIPILTASSLMGTGFDSVKTMGNDSIAFTVHYTATSAEAEVVLPGDMNHDGHLDKAEDTRLFALALVNRAEYESECASGAGDNARSCLDGGVGPGSLDGYATTGEIHANGILDFDDIDDFAAIMGISPTVVGAAIEAELRPVPEPSCVALLACVGWIMQCQRRRPFINSRLT